MTGWQEEVVAIATVRLKRVYGLELLYMDKLVEEQDGLSFEEAVYHLMHDNLVRAGKAV